MSEAQLIKMFRKRCFFVLLFLLVVMVIKAEDIWRYHLLSSDECRDCGKETNPLCSLELGTIPQANVTKVAGGACSQPEPVTTEPKCLPESVTTEPKLAP